MATVWPLASSVKIVTTAVTVVSSGSFQPVPSAPATAPNLHALPATSAPCLPVFLVQSKAHHDLDTGRHGQALCADRASPSESWRRTCAASPGGVQAPSRARPAILGSWSADDLTGAPYYGGWLPALRETPWLQRPDPCSFSNPMTRAHARARIAGKIAPQTRAELSCLKIHRPWSSFSTFSSHHAISSMASPGHMERAVEPHDACVRFYGAGKKFHHAPLRVSPCDPPIRTALLGIRFRWQNAH